MKGISKYPELDASCRPSVACVFLSNLRDPMRDALGEFLLSPRGGRLRSDGYLRALLGQRQLGTMLTDCKTSDVVIALMVIVASKLVAVVWFCPPP